MLNMNRQEVEEIFNKNIGLVYYILKRRIFNPAKYGLDDLCQEGRIGLYKAILDYYENKPELNKYSFSTVAYAYIFRYLRNYVITQNRYYKRYYMTEDSELHVKVDSEISKSFTDLIDIDLHNSYECILNIVKKVLLPKQYNLLCRIISTKYNLSEIAREDGISRQAVSLKYNKILRKLREDERIKEYYLNNYVS